mgnify:CR=1 FL=1
MGGGPTGSFSRGRGERDPSFALKITEIQYLSTFKQMLAVCICLTHVTGSNHEEVSSNRDTLFVCVLVLYHIIFSRRVLNPLMTRYNCAACKRTVVSSKVIVLTSVKRSYYAS